MHRSTILKLAVFCFALSFVPLVNGCSEDSVTAPEPVIQDTMPPAPPIAIQVQRRETGVMLSWAPSPESDIAGYNVWVYCPSPGTIQAYRKLNTDLVKGTEFGTKNLPKVGPDYYFKLTAVDQNGNQSAFSTTVVAEVPYVMGQ